jgi:hypothetical protein
VEHLRRRRADAALAVFLLLAERAPLGAAVDDGLVDDHATLLTDGLAALLLERVLDLALRAGEAVGALVLFGLAGVRSFARVRSGPDVLCVGRPNVTVTHGVLVGDRHRLGCSQLVVRIRGY